mmetsp:Transcript_32645/g.112364  ORF Transcript_32645/g.112364 Transcript_32645/m.112364 type:complete len:275 (-) Transcript_32645:256-1080(-)
MARSCVFMGWSNHACLKLSQSSCATPSKSEYEHSERTMRGSGRVVRTRCTQRTTTSSVNRPQTVAGTRATTSRSRNAPRLRSTSAASLRSIAPRASTSRAMEMVFAPRWSFVARMTPAPRCAPSQATTKGASRLTASGSQLCCSRLTRTSTATPLWRKSRQRSRFCAAICHFGNRGQHTNAKSANRKHRNRPQRNPRRCDASRGRSSRLTRSISRRNWPRSAAGALPTTFRFCVAARCATSASAHASTENQPPRGSATTTLPRSASCVGCEFSK